MHRCERFPELLADLLGGDLDDHRRKELASHLEACETCRNEADELVPLWQHLGELPEETPGPRLAEGFRRLLETAAAVSPFPQHTRRRRRSWGSALPWAATLAAVLFGVVIGRASGSNPSRDALVDELRGEVASVTRLVTLSLLESRSASERLRAVSLTSGAAASDVEVIDGLLAVVARDANPAVRVAAIEAIARWADQPRVSQALHAALASENAPLAQITLLDVLAATDADAAMRAVQQIRERPTIHPEVLRHAEELLRAAV